MRSFIRFLSRRAPRRAPSRPPHRFRPQLEGLSLRIVPSNNFTGASGDRKSVV